MTSIYHITHVKNLADIVVRGALLSDTAIRQEQLHPRAIAYGHIKERRSRTSVTLPPHGVVTDYVPFYFCARSPMLFAIHSGQVPAYPGGQNSVVHLLAEAEALEASGLRCMHTDGNAASQPLRFFPDTTTLRTALSWDVIESWSWRNTPEDNDRKRRKQAEFLVWQAVPWTSIARIGVADPAIEAEVQAILANAAHRPPVTICKDWYYT